MLSFAAPCHVVLIGHTGGIGRALLQQLLADDTVTAISAASRGGLNLGHAKLVQEPMDMLDEASIAQFAETVRVRGAPRLIILATGLLHAGGHIQPEKSWRALNAESMMATFAANAIGPALVAKHFLPLLPRTGKSVFAALSARVGSISDNQLGGWYGYRSAKAALNMLIKTLSIELQPRWPEAICVGLHPGTVDTSLSKPFQSNVRAGQLFSPAAAAAHLLLVIDGLCPDRTGELISLDGSTIGF